MTSGIHTGTNNEHLFMQASGLLQPSSGIRQD